MSEILTELTPKKKQEFLNALAKGASVTKAAAAAGMNRTWVYQLRKEDESFAEEWDTAVEQGTDTLEDEALRRAKDGTLKPIYQKGFKVGTVREYSDTLMIVLLKARRPDKYKDRAEVKQTGAPTLNLILNGNIAPSETNNSPPNEGH